MNKSIRREDTPERTRKKITMVTIWPRVKMRVFIAISPERTRTLVRGKNGSK